MLSIFKEMSLSGKIFTGLIGGFLFGLILVALSGLNPWVDVFIEESIIGLFSVAKTLFVNALKMVVVPLVLVSLICGVCTLTDPSKLGPLAVKSLGLYLLTTATAISLALLFASFIDFGAGISGEEIAAAAKDYVPKEAPPISAVFSGLVPSNPFQAMSGGNMLQIIVFAILFGIAISRAGEKAKKVSSFFEALNEVILKLVTIIMHIAPYGVFCIMSTVVFSTGLDALAKLASYFILVAVTLVIHFALTYPTFLVLFAGLNPLTLIKKLRPAILFAFSTSSSAATLPVTMEIARKRIGVGKTTASFTLPMGATINMDGTAIMQGVATVFIAQISGVDLNSTQYLTIILMATLASVGTAAVPSVGLITLTMVLTQVNLPTEAIGMLLGVDRLLDMMRTSVNVTGDVTVSTIVSKSENDFCIDTFNDPEAGLDFEEVDEPAKS